MMTENKDKLFIKYVEGGLSPEEQQKALRIFADDEEMRSMLQFELQLKQSFREEPDLTSFEVPESFSEQVMHEVRSLEATEEKVDNTESTTGWLDWLLQPRPITVRPAFAMVLVLLLAVFVALPDFSGQEEQEFQESPSPTGESVEMVSETTEEVWLRFVYIDEQAESVAVAGDFSNWDPVSLTKEEVNGEEVWTGLVSMTRGEHRYMFVRNGEQWVTDPLAPMHREDGFGNKNAVIYL